MATNGFFSFNLLIHKVHTEDKHQLSSFLSAILAFKLMTEL